MESFVERYHAWIDELLNDPSDRRRHPVAKRLRDLDAHQKTLFERILKTSQARSQIGYCETTMILQNDVEFYRWPGNFRRFLRMERRVDGDPKNVMETLGTIAPWDRTRRGIVLMTPERGFRISPPLTVTEDQEWTLCYQKGPIHPHWGSFAAAPDVIGSDFLKIPATIPAEQGTVVRWPHYYVGEVLRIVDASTGAGQFIEVESYNPGDGRLTLRHNFTPVPTGTVKYEFGSFIPEGLDKIVAVSVALGNTPVADRSEQRRLLMMEWKELFAAVMHYFNSTTTDRPHSANPTYAATTVDPMAI